MAAFRLVLLAVVVSLGGCSRENEFTDKQRACIAQRYKDYDARQLNQCLDVCKTCMDGTTVTCNTSCKLKGAT